MFTYLKHRRYSTARGNHANSVNLTLNHLITLLVSHHELRISNIVHIATNSRQLHISIAKAHFVEKLGENATFLVLEIPQVHLDEQIDVASIGHLAQWMVISLKFVSVDGCFEL